jgi:membrane-associated protease RseP (regulator of RpoE activity)
MSNAWTPILVFFITFLLLWWVKQRITWILQELSVRWMGDLDVALVIYFVIVLPGVVVHELSHWLMAKALGVRVRKLSIGPVRQKRGDRVSLGSIQVGNVDPVRASLIGMAPLLGGTAVILVIGFLVLGVGDLVHAIAGQGMEGGLAGLGQLVRIPDFWLWLYLIFGVSNAMLPSESDMATVRPVLIFLAIATAIFLVVAGVPAIPEGVVEAVIAIARYLAIAFCLTLVVDAVFVAVFMVLLWLTRWWQDRRPMR